MNRAAMMQRIQAYNEIQRDKADLFTAGRRAEAFDLLMDARVANNSDALDVLDRLIATEPDASRRSALQAVRSAVERGLL